MDQTRQFIFEHEFYGKNKADFFFAPTFFYLEDKTLAQLKELAEAFLLESGGAVIINYEEIEYGVIHITLNPTMYYDGESDEKIREVMREVEKILNHFRIPVSEK